jgi:16S rRNA processing protein RimM
MGRIGRPHGVRGLVHLVSYTDPPEAIFGYATLTDDAGRTLRLSRAGGAAELLARIDGIADRDAAARLTNAALYVERASLPEPEPEAFYHADLLGLAVEDSAGLPLGRVTEVHDHGAGVSLEISRDGAAPLLLPFTRAAVPVVDVAGGRIVVEPPTEIIVPQAPEQAA